MKKVYYVYYPNDNDKYSMYIDITSIIAETDIQPLRDNYSLDIIDNMGNITTLDMNLYINSNNLTDIIISFLLYNNNIESNYISMIQDSSYITSIKTEYGVIIGFSISNNEETGEYLFEYKA